MSKVVYKYPILIKDEILLQLPKNAEILFAETQNDRPYIWCLVNPKLPLESRTFNLYGTGYLVEEEEYFKKVYIGTFRLVNDNLILHLFEKVAK